MILCNTLDPAFDYEFEKLIRLFLPNEKIRVCHEVCEHTGGMAVLTETVSGNVHTVTARLFSADEHFSFSDSLQGDLPDFSKECERVCSVCLFKCFCRATGYRPPWGILTGVRPARLFSRLALRLGNDGAVRHLREKLLVTDEKISLCRAAVKGEEKTVALSRDDSFSLYLSVPFCPSICSYCSFVSHSAESAAGLIPDYVKYLCREIEMTAEIASDLALNLETVYMGGGTPTVLTPRQLETVFSTLLKAFNIAKAREFTVEAGRPDTITREKLEVIKNAGATRISINPQTMNDSVLIEIGRKHTAEQMTQAFYLAREMGFNNINTDLIAGLPTDTYDSFCGTLDKICAFSPESVTVHALSMKRASRLTADNAFPEISVGEQACRMVDRARTVLEEKGFIPYYMYRQSKTVGNLENVGYSKPGFEGLYNVYIMDETHTILSCGASAVTKLRQPRSEHIERIFNFKYPYEYISRFNEITDRKAGIYEFYEKHFKTNK